MQDLLLAAVAVRLMKVLLAGRVAAQMVLRERRGLPLVGAAALNRLAVHLSHRLGLLCRVELPVPNLMVAVLAVAVAGTGAGVPDQTMIPVLLAVAVLLISIHLSSLRQL
jgi:hypothetical protein